MTGFGKILILPVLLITGTLPLLAQNTALDSTFSIASSAIHFPHSYEVSQLKLSAGFSMVRPPKDILETAVQAPLNSRVWAPRWTLGTQNNLVSQVHDEGRLAICWTIDNPAWIEDYIENGLFDGLLSNFPYVVAYYHYIQE
jgi:hypothetical protein